MLGVIYKATCDISHKSYIGQTNDFPRRKREHLRSNDNSVFHLALQKYGSEHFHWEILEECSLEQLDERECYWIKYYNTYYNGYNSTKGGDNAASLLTWQQQNPEKVQENALNGLKYAQQYNKEHKQQHLEQLASVRPKAIKARSKEVRCIELDKIFSSLSDAERWSLTEENPNHKKASHQHISKVCSGLRKTCGGYHWEYV